MQILTLDIGTGTQDILLFDSERTPENCLKLVMPSPTLLFAERVRRATAARQALLITGVIMGGGPCAWAVDAHRQAGLRVIATPDAARTFNDDLDVVCREMGVEIVGEEEGAALAASGDLAHVSFRDFDFEPIRQAFAAFGLQLRPDALALGVFDHGNAPRGISDRQFRMEYLAERLKLDRRLTTFAVLGDCVPRAAMTRLRALADTAASQTGLPVVVMDTAPAAVLGAFDDPVVSQHPDPMVVNVGNFHTLAFQFRDGEFVRLFEHHTGLLDSERLAGYLRALADGTVTHAGIFADHGHGALALDHATIPLDFLAVTGPRRCPDWHRRSAGRQGALGRAPWRPDAGRLFCLLRACATLRPEWRDPIAVALAGRRDQSLW